MIITRTLLCLAAAAALANAQELNILYSFGGTNTDETLPVGTLTETAPGQFIGESGSVVFQITNGGVYTALATFNTDTQGFVTAGQLFPATNGFFYGTNISGTNGFKGSLYATSTTGKLKILLPNTGQASTLMEAVDGNLYGVNQDPTTGDYWLFRMSLSGTITNLYDMGPNGYTIAALYQASDGYLYGMTTGQNDSPGVLFRASTSGHFRILHTFPNGMGGLGGLTQASNGLLYGVAVAPPPYAPCPGIGAYIFSLSLSGTFRKFPGNWTGCSVYGGINGPSTGLVEGSDGNLYGATGGGGGFSMGSVFRVNLEGTSFFNLLNFDLGNGAGPAGYGGYALVQGSDGYLYGMAEGGGAYDGGTIYQLGINAPPPLPTVRLFAPASGAPGTAVRISGSHLIGVTGVSFNGVPATSISSRGDYFVVAVVPPGATTGPITVTTPNGSGAGTQTFTVD